MGIEVAILKIMPSVQSKPTHPGNVYLNASLQQEEQNFTSKIQ